MRPHMMEEPESKPAETEFTGALVGMALLLLSPLLLDDNAGLAYVSLYRTRFPGHTFVLCRLA